MTTLYYAIRYREPFELLDVKLNIELENVENAKEITRFAKRVEHVSFDSNPVIMESVIDEIDAQQFIGIPQPYLQSQVMDPNNNLLVLFSQNAKREVQIECIVTYHQIEIRRETSIEIPAIAIIDLPKKDLHVSGSDVIKWLYRSMKTAGGYSLEIEAIGSAMKFWHEKMGFKWKRLNPTGKRATIIREIKRKQQTQKVRPKEILQKEIDDLYYHIPSARMSRTRSDRSNRSSQSPNDDDKSPMMLSLHDIEEMHRDALIHNILDKPNLILRSNSTRNIRHKSKKSRTAKKQPHSI